MTSKNIKVNGPFVVGPPAGMMVKNGASTPREFFPIIHQDNVLASPHAAICYADYKENAHWIANALNMMMAIDESKVLHNMEISNV